MALILGLDISSSCCGYAIVDLENGLIIEYGHIDVLKKNKYNIVERLDDLSNQIKQLCIKWQPERIAIEEISKFMAHRSSANTMITLGIFNRVCALTIYQTIKKIPRFYAPISIRSKIKKFIKMDEKIYKENIPDIINKYFSNNIFKIKYNKKGSIDKKTYDESDAIAVAIADYIEANKIK